MWSRTQQAKLANVNMSGGPAALSVQLGTLGTDEYAWLGTLQRRVWTH
jgi:hypothetical protein